MVKVADVVAIGDSQQRIFPARMNPGILPICRSNAADRLNPLMCVREPVSLRGSARPAQRPGSAATRQRTADRSNLAQRQFDRFQTLAGRQAISKAEMDIQRANRDSANAALKIAREELSQMTLTAPFSGIAASVPIRNHQVVAAGQPIVTLTRTDLLDVVFSIPENLFTTIDIRNAQYRPVVKINSMPDRQFTAEYKEHTGSSDSNI
jgi:RND family efflux transporter MFP subunit